MGGRIKRTKNEAVHRWQEKMPKFFQRIVILCACVVATAFTVNTAMQIAGAEPHEWWRELYPLLIGVPVGMAVVCKLTVAGGYKDLDADALVTGKPVHVKRRAAATSRGERYDDSDVDTDSNEGA